ncbi:MAG: DNA-deoxyinosine glycosylase [Raoultibacter sp.]
MMTIDCSKSANTTDGCIPFEEVGSVRAAAHIEHPLAPIFNEQSRVLVLGTMPSPVSREIGFYYGHPQNRFWKVLGGLFDESEPITKEERTAFLLAHHIALWDVLASCDIEGASDASIINPVPNDLTVVLDGAPIHAVFTTGAKAAALYRRFNKPLLERLPFTALPSTSPANARMRLPELVEAYSKIKNALAKVTY